MSTPPIASRLQTRGAHVDLPCTSIPQVRRHHGCVFDSDGIRLNYLRLTPVYSASPQGSSVPTSFVRCGWTRSESANGTLTAANSPSFV